MQADAEREFAEYVTGRMARLHRAAYLLCGDATRADDIVQATLVSLYAKWPRARRADNIEGYVHRILVRRFLDERRSPWARIVLAERLPEQPGPAGTPVEDRDAVVTALRGVPKGQRAVLVLRFLCDLSVEETAEVLGCSVGNVKSQSARGLATLRDLMTRDLMTRDLMTRDLMTRDLMTGSASNVNGWMGGAAVAAARGRKVEGR